MSANVPLETLVGERLAASGLTLALAESCTGGLVAHRVTNVSGSSGYLLGGVVSYSNEAKESLLGVRHETLLAHGAVSEQVAVQMARGVRERLGSDIGLSVTGIAGPTGGTDDKPVGLTWIGFSTSQGDRAERFVWELDREGNKAASADAALEMIADYAASTSQASG